MMRAIGHVIFSYLFGSVLYANVFGSLFGKREAILNSPDRNPGAANAFQYGGFWCGLLTLLCDILKGFLPVFLYLRAVPDPEGWALALVLAAPVIGHILPVFHRFRGGKGIAVTFGCLLGLCPYWRPFLLFAAVFIFLSVGVQISPHFYRTIAAYLLTAVLMPLAGVRPVVWAGFLVIAGAVCLRMHKSTEEREKVEVKLLWMR